MNEVNFNLSPAKWQTCVRTIKCDTIDEYVSLMVKNDWTAHCTWYRQFKDLDSKSLKRARPNRETRKKMELCQGPGCSYIANYRDQLIGEEQKAA
jgi:hypothetical protein